MRLSLLYEQGHWEPLSGHPGKLGTDKRKRRTKRISFLVNPSDRERFLNWASGNAKNNGKSH